MSNFEGMILAIDPGPIESAYVVWDGNSVHWFGKVANYDLLALPMADAICLCAIECVTGYGIPAGQETFETCRWEGKFELSFEGSYETIRVRRRDIKSHLCENPTAKDSHVRAALIDRLGPQGTKKKPGPTYGISADVWAALAVAVYSWDNRGTLFTAVEA